MLKRAKVTQDQDGTDATSDDDVDVDAIRPVAHQARVLPSLLFRPKILPNTLSVRRCPPTSCADSSETTLPSFEPVASAMDSSCAVPAPKLPGPGPELGPARLAGRLEMDRILFMNELVPVEAAC